MKRQAILVLAGALAALTAAGCGKKAELAFVTNGVASFWNVAKAGCKAAEKEFGVKVDVLMPAQGISDQKQILEDLLTRGIRGIAVSPIDPANQTMLLDTLAGQTKVITHDSDAPASKRLCYVGMDNYVAGRLCGKLVKEALPDGGQIMLFVGRLEQDNAKRRRQGVIDEILGLARDPERHTPPDEVVKNDKYTILGTLTDQFDHSKGKANAEDALTKHPELGCMVGLFAYNPPLCLEALKQHGKVGKVRLVGFDEDEATLQGVKDGPIYGTVVQDPWAYGFESVRILAGLLAGDESVLPEGGALLIPARVVKIDDVDAFWADLRQKLAAATR